MKRRFEMFKYEELKKYWVSYFDENREKEIEERYREVFFSEFQKAVKEDFSSETQTFFGEVSNRTENFLVKFLERQAFDSCPDYQFLGVKFFDAFMFSALDNLMQSMNFKELLSDLFCDCADEIRKELLERNVISDEGNLIKNKD